MNKKINISFQEFQSLQELPNSIQDVFNRAFKAREVAYAPYSNFKVGAALLLENQEIIVGSNQENASYPVGICAERVGLSAASSQFPNVSIQCICIVAGKDLLNEKAIAPCGICRQSLLEYEHKQNSAIRVYFMGTKGKVMYLDSVKQLLPFSFDGNALI